MHIARFSYSIKPVDRERALALLGQEVEAARRAEARLLVPLTRPSRWSRPPVRAGSAQSGHLRGVPRGGGGWGGQHPRLVA